MKRNKYKDYFSTWFSDTKDVKEWGMDMYLDSLERNHVEKEQCLLYVYLRVYSITIVWKVHFLR